MAPVHMAPVADRRIDIASVGMKTGSVTDINIFIELLVMVIIYRKILHVNHAAISPRCMYAPNAPHVIWLAELVDSSLTLRGGPFVPVKCPKDCRVPKGIEIASVHT
jgi:hypothetical protein